VSQSVGPACCAHVDEGGARLAGGGRLYGLAAMLTSPADHVEINAQLGGLLLPGRAFLHHYDETAERRVKIANTIATLPIHGAILGLTETTDQAQERARAKLMAWLLSRLQHAENVRHVMVERREGGDKHDRRVLDRLRRSRRVSGELHMDHAMKSASPPLWIADFVVGSYFGDKYHQDHLPWEILSFAHLIDVVLI
jgi:hypothetical protein